MGETFHFFLLLFSLCVLGNFNIMSCLGSFIFFRSHTARERVARAGRDERNHNENCIPRLTMSATHYLQKLLLPLQGMEEAKEEKLNGKHKLSCETARQPSSREDIYAQFQSQHVIFESMISIYDTFENM